MGYPLTTPSDYKEGRFALPYNKFTKKNITAFISETEECRLIELLGVELAELFIADLDTNNVPQSARFQVIYNKLYFKESCNGELYKSDGLLNMLKGFVVFYYARSLDNPIYMVGTVSAEGENVAKKDYNHSQTPETYNLSMDAFQAIRRYICDNETTYPEYDGVDLGYLTII